MENDKKYKTEIFDNDLNLVNNDTNTIDTVIDDSNVLPPNAPLDVPKNETTESKDAENDKANKKTRGRPKGSTKEKIQGTKPKDIQGAKPNAKQDIDLSQYGQIEAPANTNTEIIEPSANVDISKYISGALLLMMIDFLLPTVFTFVYPKLKKLKDKKKLKMTKDERKELEPIADECIKQVAMKLAPMEAMALMLLFVYGGKIYELEDSDFKI